MTVTFPGRGRMLTQLDWNPLFYIVQNGCLKLSLTTWHLAPVAAFSFLGLVQELIQVDFS